MRFHPFAYDLPPFLIGAAAVAMLQTQVAAALTAPEIGQIAKAITVQIESLDHGSGVIIKRDGNIYTVLTAAHVVKNPGTYAVITADGKRFSVNVNTIKRFAGVDLAVLQFSSSQKYAVAEMGDSAKVIEGSPCYVAGFPLKTKAITESIYSFTTGKVSANAKKPLADGYALVYSNSTLPGMSGGPVLDEQGRLIGIHGRADASNDQSKALEINPFIVVKTGFNLGIPINTFLRAVTEAPPKPALRVAKSTGPTQPKKALDFFSQGTERYRKKDFKNAIAKYDEAIAADSGYAKAYIYRGLSYYGLKEYAKAIADFGKAIEISPKSTSAYINRGAAYHASKEYARAIADYNQAMAINPELSKAFYLRGLTYYALKEYTKAIADYTKAIAISPDLTGAYYGRAAIYNVLQEYTKTIADCTKAIAINPEHADSYAIRGIAYAKTENRQQAKEDLQTAAKLFQKQGRTARLDLVMQQIKKL
jgi:tetratricopeptide (TPR) repeat protein